MLSSANLYEVKREFIGRQEGVVYNKTAFDSWLESARVITEKNLLSQEPGEPGIIQG